MSVNVNTAFVQQYATNVGMLLQQQGSRLRGAVTPYSFVGKAASMMEQFGQVSPVRNQSRHSDTPLISTPQDKRWVYPNDYDWADLIDQQDRLRMLIDPSGPYTMAGSMAMGRAIDDEILASVARNAESYEILREMGIVSVMTVAIRDSLDVVGVATANRWRPTLALRRPRA